MSNRLFNFIVGCQILVILVVIGFVVAGDSILSELNNTQPVLEMSKAELNR